MPDDPQSVPGRKTIYVHRMCGAGNQLFQWAFSKALAIELDADLYFGSDASCMAHDDILFKFPGISKIKTPPPGTPVFAAGIKATPEDFENAMRYIANTESEPVIISGNFQRHTHIGKHEVAIREALTIEPLPEYEDCIAVCVRRRDFPATGLYIDLPPRWFSIAVEHVKNRISRPGRVVVFSDDRAWCRANLPWQVASKDAWHDLRAISSCAGVVFTNSTFHWWGAWLANVPTVCAASINYQYPETFYDPRWAQMHNNGVVSIPVAPGGHVTSAIYGADRGRFDVTNVINKLYADGLRHVRASNELAGDPAPNIVKRLELEFADGRKLRVPEGEIADIGHPFYGQHTDVRERQTSLCIPHYSGPNCERTSMLLQSFEKVADDPRISEIIINDDHSDDDAYREVERAVKSFPKVKIFRNEQNLGPYRNRKTAIERATNLWVISFENDNVLDPAYLDKVFAQEWREDTILAPDFAKPQLDFRQLRDTVITKDNVASHMRMPEFFAFINDGNYFVNRRQYLDAWDGSIDPATSGIEYFNSCWLANDGKIKVVTGLEYFHRPHPQSGYAQNPAQAGRYHGIAWGKLSSVKLPEPLRVDLHGKLAVVTGAAGELGRTMALTLARCGADVVIHYRSNKNEAEVMLTKVLSIGRRGMIVQADVGDAASVNQMHKTVCEQLGDADIVVANAVTQIHPWQTVLEESIEDYESQFRSCVLQNVFLAKAFVPAMIRKNWGRVIAISTECVMQCTSTQSAYVAGKRGMDGVLRVLAREVGQHQITVNQVAPGWTVSERDRRAGSQSQPQYEQNVPLRRRGTDQDVANAVAFLASDLASFITGIYLPVCGGNVMG